MKEYTVIWKGQTSGPYSESQIRALIAQGDLREVHTILHRGVQVPFQEFSIGVAPLPMESRSAAPAAGLPHRTPGAGGAFPQPVASGPQRQPAPPVSSNNKKQLPTFDSEEGGLPLPPNPPTAKIVPQIPAPPTPTAAPAGRASDPFKETNAPSPPKPREFLSENQDSFQRANYQAASSPTQTSGLAVASLVLGLVGVLGGFLILIPPILTVIFGHVALAECQKNRSMGGSGMAVAGLVLGWVCIALIAGWFLLAVLVSL